MDVSTGIRELVAREAGINIEQVTDDSNLDELSVDSLSVVLLAVGVEQQFGVRLPDSQLAKLRTVGETVAAVESTLASQA